MKPDGVATAALDQMESLDSDPVTDAAAETGQDPDQAASPTEEGIEVKPETEMAQEAPKPEKAKETPAAKNSSKTIGDPKAKAPTKGTVKTKPGTTTPGKTTAGSKTSTAQSRLSNGVSKPQTNGVAKKTAPTADKKSTAASAPSKKPTGTSGAPASKTTTAKVGEKKATGTATNSSKPTAGTTAAKKPTSSTATNGVKSTPATAAAKRPAAPKTAGATPTKPGSVVSNKPDKPPISKTTRTTTGSAASTRPATGSTRPNTSSTNKSSTPKTPSTAAKPPALKVTSTTPSGGKTPASQTARGTTPAKKDVTKPATSVSKKPAESPVSRSATSKAAKPETPKSASKADVTAKKPAANKVVDTKTPSRSKPSESKPSKDASKTLGSKATPTKASSPKKTVGSTTPTPVKRGAKAASESENGKEIAAAVATAAVVASAAAVIASVEKPEPFAEELIEVTPEKGPEIKPESILATVAEPTVQAVREPSPEPVRELAPTSVREPTPEPVRELTPEPVRELTPEPVREPTPEPIREPTPEPIREPTPEPIREPTPEPIREPTPEPIREPTPEPVREPTPQPIREPTPEPVRVPTPEPMREPTPEPVQLLMPEPLQTKSPEPLRELTPEPTANEVLRSNAEPAYEPVPSFHLSAQIDPFKFEEPANESVPALGTTVMSPPCSPPGLSSPVRESHGASSILDMRVQPDLWDRNQSDPSSTINQGVEKEDEQQSEEEDDEDERENLFMPTSTAPASFNHQSDDFTGKHLLSPFEKEEAVEKADQEINDDDDDDEEEDEDEEHRRHQPSSLITDMSMSQPSEEFQAHSSAFGGSAGWHGDDLLSGMDSEDVSSCTSSRQQGVSDLSSTLHTAILEGTQSSDALVDSSLRGSEGDGNLMGSPNVETLANEEEEDDEEDERVDDMDLSSERVEEHPKAIHDYEDEDVEMHSEGVTESGENAEEDDFNEEQRVDNLNVSAPSRSPPAATWSQSNPFSDTWAQPTSALSFTSPSPLSDHGAADSETPTQSPARACLDIGTSSFTSHTEQMKDSSPEEDQCLPAVPAAGERQPTHSGSESSTPEDLRDYDSSSGVESRSDKQHTPVPAAVPSEMDQDLGIHLEKGDGEEEEAETLPADEVLGTGPPTAPASAPSSASTSGDEASDTEGEIQINDPDAPMMMDESAGFESPPPDHSLPALEEDEEVGDIHAEEDGGGATPQSANSVASYGFDCTTSNSNAHSMAESCGKSPGIFSLENEEQLPEEAKDPSLIKELTYPSAAATAQAEDLLGRPVDLMPLGGNHHGMGDHHYMLGGKMAAEYLEGEEPMKQQESEDLSDIQPPYYSTICDKTDSFLEGNV